MTDPDLVAAARFELQRREASYPALVASGKLSADEATIDFQAWHCILGWLESGRFECVNAGGIDGQTIVDWALAEDAAERALTKITASAEKATADKAPALWARRAALHAIAGKVRLRRQTIEVLNRQFRERKAA
jgi:hypothetical protein